MIASSLDRRIVIEKMTVTRDVATGAEVRTWGEFASTWAEKRESSTGTERLVGGASIAARPTKFRIRWRDGVTTAMRVREGSRLYQIIGTAEMGRRMGLEMSCVEWSHE